METIYDTFDLDSSYRDTIFGLESVVAQMSVYENIVGAVLTLSTHDCSRGMESFYKQFSLEEESTGAVNGSSETVLSRRGIDRSCERIFSRSSRTDFL